MNEAKGTGPEDRSEARRAKEWVSWVAGVAQLPVAVVLVCLVVLSGAPWEVVALAVLGLVLALAP